MKPLTIEGSFRVVPRDWYVKQFESGAVAASFRLEIIEEHNPSDGTWRKWPAHDPREVIADFCLVKRDGAPNEKLVRALAAALGWPGDLAALDDPQSQFRAFAVDCREETYNGTARIKAVWPHPWDHQPRSALTADEMRRLESRHGDALRALAGPEAQAAAAVREAGPAPTPTRNSAAPADDPLPPTGDDIPF